MIERRKILTGAGAALTTSLFTGRVKGANGRIAVAHIGIGAMGSGNPGYAMRMPDVQPVAVCDVYQPTLDKAVARLGRDELDGQTESHQTVSESEISRSVEA